ncbi:MAG: glycosyltransferase [Marinilabiliaceae bacterium]|nr:glycosyltransferase [Marinilabiliaceae bacterium]
MPNPIKIAVVTEGFPRVSETFIITHIAALIEAGFDVTVFSTGYNKAEDIHALFKEYNMKSITQYRQNPHIGIKRYFQIPLLFLKNITHWRILLKSFSPRFFGTYALRGYFFYDVLSFITEKKFDIIHSHFGPNASKVGFIRSLGLMKGKHICTFHGHDVTNIKEIKSHYCYQHLKDDLSEAIFVVNYTKKLFAERVKYNYPLLINPVSINTSEIESKSIYRKNIESPLHIVTAGRLIDCKGQIETTQVCIDLINEGYNIYYHLIGTGENKEIIIKLIRRANCSARIILHDSQPHANLIEIVKTCDVHILFGRKDKNEIIDAQGTVVQEAQATGTPVIVSNGGGLPEGMIANQTGIVVPENDTKALKDSILFFYNNPDKIEKMGIEGRRFVEANYSNEVVYSRLFNIYKQVLNE